MQFKNVAVVSAAGVIASLALGAGGAVAATQITSAQIKDQTIRSVDVGTEAIGTSELRDGSVALNDISAGAQKQLAGQDGKKGATGEKGDKGTTGAYWAVAFYDKGDTNEGAVATVACKNQADTAISGGAQTLGIDGNGTARNTPVSSSFPGRMDWSTESPKADRTDGWIVQFGGNAQTVAPAKVKVWALCLPSTTIPVEQTYLQSAN